MRSHPPLEPAASDGDGCDTIGDAAGLTGHSDIFSLSDAVIRAQAAQNPTMATFWGVPGYDDRWPDFSPDGWQERLDLMRATVRAAEALSPRSERDRVAIDVLCERAETDADMVASGEFQVAMTTLNGHHVILRDIFEFMPRDEAAIENIKARLAGIPDALAGLRTSYEDLAARGLLASRHQAMLSADQCDVWADPDGCFAEIAAQCAAGDLSDAARAAARGFGDFAEWLRHDYAPIADPNPGLGRERYLIHARFHNGTALDIDDTYGWGWNELGTILARMDAIAAGLGFAGERQACIAHIEADDHYAVVGNESFLTWSQETIDRTFGELDGTVFDIPEPLFTCKAMQIPPALSESAYYTSPSEDFSRPGMIWHPLHDELTRYPLWKELTVVYHESVPGHHLQLGHMMHRADTLTRFQRLGVMVSAHGEGWALYAEQLMRELGFLDDPVYELGFLANQALRAARVVVDIGLHCGLLIPPGQPFHPGERWTPELAIDLIEYATGFNADRARAEVDRYLGMPAQAISYKVGERVWLAGRERTRRRLGAAFDLKRFHTDTLDLGAMGLDQLALEFDRLPG